MNYQEAIRIAEERENAVRAEFNRYDTNKSGSIDMEELLSLPNAHLEEKRLSLDFLRAAVSNMPEPCRYVVS